MTDDEIVMLAEGIKQDRALSAKYAVVHEKLDRLDWEIQYSDKKLRLIRVLFYSTEDKPHTKGFQDYVEIELPLEAGTDLIHFLEKYSEEKKS